MTAGSGGWPPRSTRWVLILGGTAEGRRLAELLVEAGVEVETSLAGRVNEPRLPPGRVRIGGFGGYDGIGGVEGFTSYLRVERPTAIVDATHPFATVMTASAAAATRLTGIPLLRLQRPPWAPQPGDDWRYVGSQAEAAAAVAGFDSVFITTGRQGLGAFAGVTARCLIRVVEPPKATLPARSTLVLDRGPFTPAAEIGLMLQHEVEVVVTKQSGGEMTRAKLFAARELGIPVILVRRPPPPSVPVVDTVEGALAWLEGWVGPLPGSTGG